MAISEVVCKALRSRSDLQKQIIMATKKDLQVAAWDMQAQKGQTHTQRQKLQVKKARKQLMYQMLIHTMMHPSLNVPTKISPKLLKNSRTVLKTTPKFNGLRKLLLRKDANLLSVLRDNSL